MLTTICRKNLRKQTQKAIQIEKRQAFENEVQVFEYLKDYAEQSFKITGIKLKNLSLIFFCVFWSCLHSRRMSLGKNKDANFFFESMKRSVGRLLLLAGWIALDKLGHFFDFCLLMKRRALSFLHRWTAWLLQLKKFSVLSVCRQILMAKTTVWAVWAHLMSRILQPESLCDAEKTASTKLRSRIMSLPRRPHTVFLLYRMWQFESCQKSPLNIPGPVWEIRITINKKAETVFKI